jgi:hypothetical protein
VATPEALTVCVPPVHEIAAPPSWNTTDPVGCPDPGAVTTTLAVYVTVWPVLAGVRSEATEVAVEALPTTWVSADVVVEVAKLPSPEYTAVRLRFPPAALKAVTQVATPALKVWLPPVQAIVPPPSLKATVPVGLPAPGATTATVAVRVTLCPVTDGLVPDSRDVVVSALSITWVTVFEVDPWKLPSPPYVAVTERGLDAAGYDVVHVA